jgi:hypothetical protein
MDKSSSTASLITGPFVVVSEHGEFLLRLYPYLIVFGTPVMSVGYLKRGTASFIAVALSLVEVSFCTKILNLSP